MKAHNLEALGFLRLHYAPTEPDHAIRKEDLDKVFNDTSQRPIFITSVMPTSEGNVGNKQYKDTTPPNKIINSCVSDTAFITVGFICDSKIAFDAPEVSVWMNDVLLSYANVEGVEGSPNSFTGSVPIEMSESGTLTLKSSQGTEASISISVEGSGPVITSLSVTAFPGVQTAVKAGDLISVEGSVENSAVEIKALNLGAATSRNYTLTLGAANSSSDGYRVFSGVVEASNASGLNRISLYAENQLGTKGTSFESDPIRLDQTVPQVTVTLSAFSNNKDALGLNDTCLATISYLNAERSEFSFDHGTFDGSPSAILSSRTLTVDVATYSLSGGITIRAWKDSNDTYFEGVFDIPISSIAPSMLSLVIENSVLRGSSQKISSLPVYGASTSPNLSVSGIDSLAQTLSSTNDQDFFLEAPAGYGYFAYPAALGRATFIDLSTGSVGGWDGATWPSDGSVGSTTGPAPLSKNGENWYVYRTDFQGIISPFLVSFQNPGLEVGEATPIPHLRSSPDGIDYKVRLEFDQELHASPFLTPPVGSWTGVWTKESDTVWSRNLKITNSDVRGVTVFSDLAAQGLSGMPVTEKPDLSYAVAGFTKTTITMPALSRIAPIGVPVYNVTNTRVNYAGSDSLLTLRTDTRDARASYSVVDSEGNYKASMGTHIWLSDVDFASANTSGTLELDIEELS